MRKIIKTENAPAAIGPYSQGVAANGFVFVSGQLPINPAIKELIKGDIKSAAKQALENVDAILKEAGTCLCKAVKINIYMINPEDFPLVNEVYKGFFESDAPARACVFVSALPMGAEIEIECVAEI